MKHEFFEAAGHEFGSITKFLIRLSGADAPTLSQCPERDVDNVRSIACLMVGVWLYQSLVFSLAAHIMKGWDGRVHPELIGAAVLVATLIMLIDSYMIMRSSWHLHGISELKRAGLDISGGLSAWIKNAAFFVVRSFLAAVLAVLTAFVFSVLAFFSDETREIDRTYQQQNSAIFLKIGTMVDGVIRNLEGLVESSAVRVAKLEDEAFSIRKTLVDPLTDSTGMQEARDRLRRLEAEKVEADASLASAVTFASDELAGIKAAKGNTGIKGEGPVRNAAQEKVAFATERQRAINGQITQAEAELASAQTGVEDATRMKRQQAEVRLGEVTKELVAERKQLAERKAEYQARTERRDQDIRDAVASDPARVEVDDGFLARLRALKRIASDAETRTLIILIHVASLGIELAAVLAKVFSFVPTAYAVKLASESYAMSVEEAQKLARKIEPRKQPDEYGEDSVHDDIPPFRPPPGDEEPPISAPLAPQPAPEEPIEATPPPRKRGRPPKNPDTNIVPFTLAGKDQGNDHDPNQDQP